MKSLIRSLVLTSALLAIPAAAESPSAGEYRNSVKWQEYQSRRATRKAEARQRSYELRAGKDYSNVSLSRQSGVNIANPFGHLYASPAPVRCWRRPAVIIIR
jgi:hypothetical protein